LDSVIALQTTDWKVIYEFLKLELIAWTH